MDPKISVIIPLYNCEKYIAKCIKSILNNTFTYFEVIIINDGSTDQSVKIIVDTISNDERFTIINQIFVISFCISCVCRNGNSISKHNSQI